MSGFPARTAPTPISYLLAYNAALASQALVLAEAAGGAVVQLGRGGRGQKFGTLRDAHAAGSAAALGPAGVPPGVAGRVDGSQHGAARRHVERRTGQAHNGQKGHFVANLALETGPPAGPSYAGQI
jgi:hypothetical protein